VIIDLSATDIADLPSKLLDVRADEWVCIGGTIGPDGDLRDPRLERTANEALFSVKVTANGPRLTYELSNLSARRLSLVGFEGTVPVRRYVEPHAVRRFESSPGASRLLFTRVSFVAPTPPRTTAPRREKKFKGRLEMMPVVGARHARDLSALNRELAENGYEPLPNIIHPVGVDVSVQSKHLWWSLQFRGSPGSVRHVSGEEVDANFIDVGVDVGRSLSPVSRLSVTPYIGTHLGIVSLDVSRKHPPLFAKEVSESESDRPLQNWTLVIPIGLDLSVMALRQKLRAGPYAGVVVGTKLGYAFALPSDGWSDNDRGIQDGPRINLSGPFVLVSLGVGLQE
jgi:hypothetical protein